MSEMWKKYIYDMIREWKSTDIKNLSETTSWKILEIDHAIRLIDKKIENHKESLIKKLKKTEEENSIAERIDDECTKFEIHDNAFQCYRQSIRSRMVTFQTELNDCLEIVNRRESIVREYLANLTKFEERKRELRLERDNISKELSTLEDKIKKINLQIQEKENRQNFFKIQMENHRKSLVMREKILHREVFEAEKKLNDGRQ